MDKVEAIKILKDFHDESAIFSVRTALETLHPELKESEDEKKRKAIIELVKQSSEILNEQNQKEMIAWLEKQGQPRMQNGITINGVEYELIKDDEADECERCFLRDKCHDSDEVLCTQLFGLDIATNHRFEKR